MVFLSLAVKTRRIFLLFEGISFVRLRPQPKPQRMTSKSSQITSKHWLCYLRHSFTYQRSPQLAKVHGSSGEAPSLVGGQTLTDSTHQHQVDPWAPRPLRYRTNTNILSLVLTHDKFITVMLRDTFLGCINMR